MEGEGEAPSAGDEANRVARLPRWTRQEILVLIQGKRVAENRVRRGRMTGPAFGSGQAVEPKWASVSSYCKRHGVNRGPVQCRKRWSNLAGDFKKIKEWESGRESESTESFWVMRNDLRREKKLPGFFDREVYDILDSSSPDQDNNNNNNNNNPLTLTLPVPPLPPAVFDSGRCAAPDDGLFSDSEQQQQHNIVNPPLPLPPTPGCILIQLPFYFYFYFYFIFSSQFSITYHSVILCLFTFAEFRDLTEKQRQHQASAQGHSCYLFFRHRHSC